MARIEIAEAFEPLFSPKRTKVFFGGRGGAKSWAFATALVLRGTQERIRVLCTRELQQSILESVHRLLSDTIYRLEMGDFYSIEKAVIRGLNGTEFIFEGLKNNTRKIKSMEGIDVCWCEEAEAISEESWDLLEPTIRKEGSEIWVSFNPNDELDATYQKFVVPHLEHIEDGGSYEDEHLYVAKVSWRDNPWLTEELRNDMERCKRTNYRKYLHIWEGECNAEYTDSIIKPEWVDAAIDAHIKLGFEPKGLKVLGYDPADEGEDAKSYAYRHGSVVLKAAQWKTDDLDVATGRVFDLADELRVDDLVYDVVGIGAGVKLAIKQRQGRDTFVITPFAGSESVRDPSEVYMDGRTNKDMFQNLRAQMIWQLRDRFEKTYKAVEKGQYVNPDEMISLSSDIEHLSILKSEISKIRRKRGTAIYRVQAESKEDMRRRGVKSPNMLEALYMSFANPPPIEDDWSAELHYENVAYA